MTILQRYGMFTLIPGVFVLLFIGVALTIWESGDTDSDTNEILAHKVAELEKSSAQSADESLVVVVVEAEQEKAADGVEQKSVSQLAQIAERANHQARGALAGQDPEDPQALAVENDAANPKESAKPAGEPTISREVITKAFQDLKPAVKACYEDMLKDFPEASGKLSMSFVFETENGMSRLQTAEFNDDTTLFDRQLHDCVAESASTIELPEMQGSGRLAVTYPFNFQPSDSQ